MKRRRQYAHNLLKNRRREGKTKHTRRYSTKRNQRPEAWRSQQEVSPEFHSETGNRQPEFPRLHSVAHRLNGFMGVVMVGELATIQKRSTRRRSEMREILIKRRRTRRHEAEASSLILQIPQAFSLSLPFSSAPSNFLDSTRILLILETLRAQTFVSIWLLHLTWCDLRFWLTSFEFLLNFENFLTQWFVLIYSDGIGNWDTKLSIANTLTISLLNIIT